jgi:putative ABC transport system substrate-binding protein
VPLNRKILPSAIYQIRTNVSFVEWAWGCQCSRKFIATLAVGVAAPMLNVGARSAQQAGKISRIGALLGWSQSDPEDRSFLAAFIEELAQLGWIEGRNTQVEQRWAGADRKHMEAFATELVASQADVILSSTTPRTAALHRETRAIPIVLP